MPNNYCSRSGTLRINNINERDYDLILTGIEQNGKEQWLEVSANAIYGNDREFFVYNLTLVCIENKNTIIPDDKSDDIEDKDENKTNNNNNTGFEPNEDEETIDLPFYIIISCFVMVIILVFIIVFIYLNKKKDNNLVVDDENYENIGIIEDKNINEDENNIN